MCWLSYVPVYQIRGGNRTHFWGAALLVSLYLSYLNDCAIISRALISSRQGGYMVHAARAATPSAPAPLPTRHFLIGRAAIKKARNFPEYNALYFSNRLKTANCSARFSRVLRPKNHDSPVARHRSRFTTHQSLPTNHAFLIASRQILKIALTTSQQTRKYFLIASFSGSLPLPPRPALVTHHCLTSLLFRTNKPHRIIILMRALMKTKEKHFSIRYKFALQKFQDAEVGLCSLTCRSYGSASRINTAASAPTIRRPARV